MDLEGLTLEQKTKLLATYTGLSVEMVAGLTAEAAKLSVQFFIEECEPLVKAHEAWLENLRNFEPLLFEAVRLAEYVKALRNQRADVG